MQFLLGPRNTALVLVIAEAIILLGLFFGFYLIRFQRNRAAHERNQTFFVVANLFFIFFAMVIGFYRYVILGAAASPFTAQTMIAHTVVGTIAEVLGLYLILRMKNRIPERFKVKNFKRLMRITLAVWALQTVGGFGIYFLQYIAPTAAAAPSAVAILQRQADDLQIHVDELQTAAKRGNAASTKRHAEHVINLIVGKNSADYGDVDKDGFVEDPGNGVGLINYLQQVRDRAAKAGGNSAQAAAVADQVRDQVIKILASTKTVLQVSDLKAAAAQVSEVTVIAEQINRGKEKSVPQIAVLLGESTAMPEVSPETSAATVTVNIKDFIYSPRVLRVSKGTMVVFVNLDQAKHTVTDDVKKYNSGDMPTGKTFTFTYNEPGEFSYYCVYHGDPGGVDMAGLVIVQ